jgi:hypothetical protein
LSHHPFKRREARLGQRFFHAPVPHAHAVHWRRGHNMLEGGFPLPDVAGASQTIGTPPLGPRPFNPGTSGICCGGGGRGLARSGGVQGLRGRLATEREHASWRAGTRGATGTRRAILAGTLPLHDRLLPLLHRRGPAGAETPARTPRLAPVPRDRAAPGSTALRSSGVPVVMGPRRPAYMDTVLARTRHPPLGVQSARLHAVRRGQHALAFQRLMPAAGDRTICHGAGRRLHRGHERRRLVVAGLGDRDCIPPQAVGCCLAERASTSYGELRKRPAGGRPACSVRQRTWPAARYNGCPHTRRKVSTAGRLRNHGGACGA